MIRRSNDDKRLPVTVLTDFLVLERYTLLNHIFQYRAQNEVRNYRE